MAQLTADVHAHNSRATHPHILPLPLWVFALRCLQALLSLVTLALSAVPLTYFPGFGGYGLNIFTSLLTWIFLLYAALTAWRFPAAYNKWAHLALEIALVVFWLCTFATLASHAAFFAVYYNHGYREDPETEAAIACTQAAAALTAFTWVSFIATLVHTSIAIHRSRLAGAPAKGAPADELKMEHVAGPQEMPQQPYPQQQQQQYQQQYTQQQYPQQQTV